MNSGSEFERNTRASRLRAGVADSVTRKFLRDFDPQRSEREKRKLHRRLYPGNKKHLLYDETGCYVKNGADMCDCLHNDCPGCHFPCSKCGSPKCGHECRIHRKWTYESIENEGSDTVKKNVGMKNN